MADGDGYSTRKVTTREGHNGNGEAYIYVMKTTKWGEPPTETRFAVRYLPDTDEVVLVKGEGDDAEAVYSELLS
jgi:hypothetical protein